MLGAAPISAAAAAAAAACLRGLRRLWHGRAGAGTMLGGFGIWTERGSCMENADGVA